MSNTDPTKANLVAPVKLDYSADPVIKSTGVLGLINWFNAAIFVWMPQSQPEFPVSYVVIFYEFSEVR
jgi:hypothetical protein